jgi:N-acetylated-alpha-linked acidic dipeptidase
MIAGRKLPKLALSVALSALIATGVLSGSASALDLKLPHLGKAAPKMDQAAVEKAFDAGIDAKEMTGWLETMSSAPNHVGSPHDKANAEFMLAKLKSWGWDAHIEEFQVLYPIPITESLELVGAEPFKATLTEPPVPGDRTSGLPGQLPAYVAFQGDGDVTADLVYVNYGMPEDYKALERKGIDVRGKIVIARYGAGWRGLKPLLAQEHGAVGCIIYSDPHEDGFHENDVYPKGGDRPSFGFQRGSVVRMMTYPGDPLTPGVGATKDAKRLTREEAPTLLKIPTLPISYGDAQHFLAALGGPVAPESFKGSLAMTYHTGPGPAKVHIQVKSDWSLKTIYDVVAVMKGSEYPDQWIMRGNHHDGWVFGASDPLSGNVAMLAEAKSIGALAKTGWRPKRTLVYLGWDAEEPGLIGSTEWVETHATELAQKGVLYINTDNIGRGYFQAEGSHSWQHMVNQVAGDVTDPETGVSLLERDRSRAQVDALGAGANERTRERAKVAAKGGDMPIGPLGSGSDYSAFLQHVGVGSLNVGFGGEDHSGGVYHSAYDSFDHYTRFDDPGLAYAATLARTTGRIALRAADAPVQPQRFADFADTVAGYDDELKKMLGAMRERGATEARLRASDAYRHATDPLDPVAAPSDEGPVPALDFGALDHAIDRLKTSAHAYDDAFAAKAAGLSPKARARLTASLQSIEQSMLDNEGLPGRPWFRNMVYAPGVLTGYGAKTLPAVREAIEGRRWDEAQRYIPITAKAVEAYAARLDAATAILNGG